MRESARVRVVLGRMCAPKFSSPECVCVRKRVVGCVRVCVWEWVVVGKGVRIFPGVVAVVVIVVTAALLLVSRLKRENLRAMSLVVVGIAAHTMRACVFS